MKELFSIKIDNFVSYRVSEVVRLVDVVVLGEFSR